MVWWTKHSPRFRKTEKGKFCVIKQNAAFGAPYNLFVADFTIISVTTNTHTTSHDKWGFDQHWMFLSDLRFLTSVKEPITYTELYLSWQNLGRIFFLKMGYLATSNKVLFTCPISELPKSLLTECTNDMAMSWCRHYKAAYQFSRKPRTRWLWRIFLIQGYYWRGKDTPKLRSKGPNLAVKFNAVLLTSRTATKILFNNNPHVESNEVGDGSWRLTPCSIRSNVL